MRDWKTTVTVVVGSVASMLGVFGIITLSPEQQAGVITVTLLVLGILARDSHPTPP